MKLLKKWKDPNNTELIACYQKDDLELLRPHIDTARDIWRAICEENFMRYGDDGSCVCGAGITLPFIKAGCRTWNDKMIISANEVARAQGSLNWEKGREKVLKYLADHGVHGARYEYGRMD